MCGLLSTKNYSAGQYEQFEDVSGERLAEVCGIGGRNEAEKENNFIRWIEETNKKMGLLQYFAADPKNVAQGLDKRKKLCYYSGKILTLSVSCVKGANMVSEPQKSLRRFSVAVPIGIRRFFILNLKKLVLGGTMCGN